MSSNNKAASGAGQRPSAARSPRSSIHTPLRPASVQDLKAKFDPGKAGECGGGGGGSDHSTSSSLSLTSRTAKAGSLNHHPIEKTGQSTFTTTVMITSPSSKSSNSVNLSSLSSSLQAAAQRKLDATSSLPTSSAVSSTSSLTSSAPTSTRSLARSPISLTINTTNATIEAVPSSSFSFSSSKSGSAPTSGRSSPSSDKSSTKSSTSTSIHSATNRWEQISSTKQTTDAKTVGRADVSRAPKSPRALADAKISFEKNKDSNLELPVLRSSTAVLGNDIKLDYSVRHSSLCKKVDERPKSFTAQKSTGESKEQSSPSKSGSNEKHSTQLKKNACTSLSSGDNLTGKEQKSNEKSTPVQLNHKLVAREIKIQRSEPGLSETFQDSRINSTKSSTLNDDKNVSGSKTTSKDSKIVTLKSTHSTQVSTKNDVTKPEASQVKLRRTKTEPVDSPTNLSSPKIQRKGNSLETEDKRVSLKINSERFERLMFDFQRGVPPETIARRGSENDHILLQQQARELSKVGHAEDEVPVIARKKKETSIFKEGLTVSDFVKQVNKMNPESEATAPRWKVQRAVSQTSSAASSEVGGDNFYQGIPGEELDDPLDDQDDIYEKVLNRATSSTDGEPEIEISKASSKKLGVYSQMKNLTNIAFKKLKQRGSKKKPRNKPSKSEGFSDSEEVSVSSVTSDGGRENGDWSSSGTDYEDVSPELKDASTTEGGMCLYEDLENYSKLDKSVPKNKKISQKLKKIFYKPGSKNKKSKSFVDSGVSAGTESEADMIDDTDSAKIDHTENTSNSSGDHNNSGHPNRDSAALTSVSSSASVSSTGAVTVDETLQAVAYAAPTFVISAPPLPPRTIKATTHILEDSPPLPPRNPSAPNKSNQGNNQADNSIPLSPVGKSIQCATESKSKDTKSTGGSTQDGCMARVAVSEKSETIDLDSSSSPLGKLKRNERKPGSAGQPTSDSAAISWPAPAYMYPDISALPELKGEAVSLYTDLEDEQIYGKASVTYKSKFASEPLYQWYSKDKVIQTLNSDKSTSDDLSSDDEYLEEKRRPESVYEDVEKLLEKANGGLTSPTTASASRNKSGVKKGKTQDLISPRDKPERRSVIEEVFKNGGSLHRALWCQMPEVIESGILDKLTDQEKKIQEAMFEIITSEASYLKSLKVLISVFLMSPEFSAEMSDKCVINRRDSQILFSNIGHIKDISEEFLKDLEDRWQESCYIKDICDIIYKHASHKFEPYARYCGNQAFQDRALNILRLNTEFSEAVRRLEQHPDCQFLPLGSFLLLPMQRITRLPLLVDAVCHRLDPSSSAHASAKKALDSLTKVAKQCDDAAKKMQQIEQICILKSNLEFKVKEIPLISASRYLIKQGELTQIKAEAAGRKSLSKLLGSNKEHVYLFLFNDILLVTKKKGVTYQVKDYCQRNAVHLETIDNPDKTHHIAPGTATGVPNILFLAMLANHENRQVEMILSCKSESERTRWMDAIMPKLASSESERIYDLWDCPQFHCVRKYIALQPDELNLEESDVINVTRKMSDGWYEGERIRDGEKGWFPACHTEEINNSHVRARNLRLRYRLMRASHEYSQTELRKK